MSYYNGSAMSMTGSYCIHYGRKGMKWYQNIFEAPGDIARATRDAYSDAKVEGRGAKYAGYNRNGAVGMNQLSANMSGDRNYANYNRVVGNVGNAIGRTAYNATVLGRNIGSTASSAASKIADAAKQTWSTASSAASKIADATKQTWSSVKQFGASAIQKGKDLLSGLIDKTRAKLYKLVRPNAKRDFLKFQSQYLAETAKAGVGNGKYATALIDKTNRADARNRTSQYAAETAKAGIGNGKISANSMSPQRRQQYRLKESQAGSPKYAQGARTAIDSHNNAVGTSGSVTPTYYGYNQKLNNNNASGSSRNKKRMATVGKGRISTRQTSTHGYQK